MNDTQMTWKEMRNKMNRNMMSTGYTPEPPPTNKLLEKALSYGGHKQYSSTWKETIFEGKNGRVFLSTGEIGEINMHIAGYSTYVTVLVVDYGDDHEGGWAWVPAPNVKKNYWPWAKLFKRHQERTGRTKRGRN